MAYYHSAVRVCEYPDWQENSKNSRIIKQVKRSFAALAVGSAFFHGSMTYVGFTFDCDFIGIIAYYAHNILVQKIHSNSTIIHELSLTPRKQSIQEIMINVTDYLAYKKPTEWVPVLNESDYPQSYYLSFGASLATGLALLLPFWFVKPFITFLAT